MKASGSNNLLDNFYTFLNKKLGKILTNHETESQTKFTDDKICKNPAKWSKFLSEALEKTISEFFSNLKDQNEESYELISSRTKNEFLVDIIIVNKSDIIKPKIEYTDEKGEGRQHKKLVDIYKKIEVAIEYEWDIGKDGCHFFTRDFPKLAHIKANYYIVIYLNPKKYKKTRKNLK